MQARVRCACDECAQRAAEHLGIAVIDHVSLHVVCRRRESGDKTERQIGGEAECARCNRVAVIGTVTEHRVRRAAAALSLIRLRRVFLHGAEHAADRGVGGLSDGGLACVGTGHLVVGRQPLTDHGLAARDVVPLPRPAWTGELADGDLAVGGHVSSLAQNEARSRTYATRGQEIGQFLHAGSLCPSKCKSKTSAARAAGAARHDRAVGADGNGVGIDATWQRAEILHAGSLRPAKGVLIPSTIHDGTSDDHGAIGTDGVCKTVSSGRCRQRTEADHAGRRGPVHRLVLLWTGIAHIADDCGPVRGNGGRVAQRITRQETEARHARGLGPAKGLPTSEVTLSKARDDIRVGAHGGGEAFDIILERASGSECGAGMKVGKGAVRITDRVAGDIDWPLKLPITDPDRSGIVDRRRSGLESRVGEHRHQGEGAVAVNPTAIIVGAAVSNANKELPVTAHTPDREGIAGKPGEDIHPVNGLRCGRSGKRGQRSASQQRGAPS